MPDELYDRIKRMLSEGKTPEQIRAVLQDQGYRKSIIDQILRSIPREAGEPGTDTRSSPSRFQIISWFILFLGLFAVYAAVGTGIATYHRLLEDGLWWVLGIGFAAQLVVTGRQVLRDRAVQYRAVAVMITVLFLFIGGALLRGDIATLLGDIGAGGPDAGRIVFFAATYLNIGLLAVAVVAAMFAWNRIGVAAIMFPLLVVGGAGGMYVMHQQSVAAAGDAVSPHAFDHPLLDTHFGSTELATWITESTRLPPPFQRLPATWLTYGVVAGEYTLAHNLMAVNETRISNMTLARLDCPQARSSIAERYGEDPRYWPLFVLERVIPSDVQEERTAFIEGLRLTCIYGDGTCNVNTIDFEETQQQYLAALAERATVFRTALGIDPVFADIPESCEPITVLSDDLDVTVGE